MTYQDSGYTDETYINYSLEVPITVIENGRPVITATDKMLKKGQKFNPKLDLNALDKENGDLTSSVQILENDVDCEQEGSYHVTYSVTDSDSNTMTKTIMVTVTSNEAPEITGEAITSVNPNSTFDVMSSIKATEKEDGDMTSSITVGSNDVNTGTSGVYTITYKVVDSDGNEGVFLRKKFSN
ncbi:DUF5011 domain-containing protein [Listeria weihenstephanensis]|uniref:DUF5011 domain-containing protein n=1 Tax=Listeria weihenstephanensis TaxID=1006155 RepID=A0A841Z9K8_9LIST|nr:immunoglobulin-like domain-containing protein [Listeria weihenstephanensis]MBC1501880.1 DUF5011 domain-containing protein [Listeria weihenstephanensis]